MKAIITVLKKDLEENSGLIETLATLCSEVDVEDDHVNFHPLPKKNMEFICLLLNENIPYRLTIENSLKEIGRPSNGHNKKARS